MTRYPSWRNRKAASFVSVAGGACLLGLSWLGAGCAGSGAAPGHDLDFSLARTWVADPESGRILEIDRDSGRVLETVRVGGVPQDLAIGHGCLWGLDPDQGSMFRIEPSGRISRLRLGGLPVGLAVSPDAVWVTLREKGSLLRIDPARNEVVSEIDLGWGANRIAAGERDVWVTNLVKGSVSRIDPARNEVVWTRVPDLSGIAAICVGGGSVWVTDLEAGKLTRIDGTTGDTVAGIELEEGGLAGEELAWQAGSLWATATVHEELLRIDPATNRVVERVACDGRMPHTVVALGESLWITVPDPGLVGRVDLAASHPILWIETGGDPWSIADVAPAR